jgi:cellobiose-specific phosphotransferase system component IIC
MTWMGWLMSALGFTWCYVLIVALLAHSGGYLTAQQTDAAMSLGYLIVLPGVLVAGLFIWIDSLVRAWRERDLPSIGIAAWNTFAQVHNTYAAVEGVGGAAKSVGSLFSSADPDDIKGTAVVAVVVIILAALASGFVTTEMIRRHYAASRPLPARAAPAPA